MELFMLTGGAGAVVAFLIGLAYARSLFSLLILASVGVFIVMGYHAVANPTELMHATANANLLGWLTGAVLAARLRALEWLTALDGQTATSRT